MPNTAPTQVFVLHHDPLVYAGLAATLLTQADIRLFAPDSSGRGNPGDLVSEPCGPLPDVVVADYEYGLALIAAARQAGDPGRKLRPNVLIVTQRDSEWEIRNALELGARGYLILGCGLDELLDGVRALHRGLRHIGVAAARRLADSVACDALTCRETEVLRLVAEGRCNKAIARQLDIAVGTVKSHLKAIFEKLNATSRTEVAAVAERRGLLALPELELNRSAFTPRPTRRVGSRSAAMLGAAVH